MDKDTLQPCGGNNFVLSELVVAGTSAATYGGCRVLYRHAVGGLYLYAHGGYMDVPVLLKKIILY